MTRNPKLWTNPSVKALAGVAEPVEAITKKVRALVLAAMDSGWSGPPFDPLSLSDFLKIRAVPRGDVRDARIVPTDSGLCIEYNPTRPRGRVRYSIAHEIAHSLFPDCSSQIRTRAARQQGDADDWQLEALCNIAAAEILMPMGSIGHLAPADLSIDSLLKLRQQYDVSTEAILIRAVSAARSACEAFCASRIEAAEPEVQYRLDYLIASKSWGITSGRGERLNKPATISQCSAIGYTAKGIEQIGGKDVRVECVGIPAYPGTTFPRVAGVLTPIGEFQSRAPVTFLKGDALEPRGEGPKIIAHIVNDATPMWGGRGFAQAVRRKWPAVQENFAKWVTENESGLSLGSVHLTHVNSELAVASLVSQRGYGASTHARLRYAALESCLVEITRVARKQKASIHMPRIGCGAAGGSWDLVEELIVDTLVASDVPVFVYDLPGVEAPLQSALFLEPR